MKQYIIKQVISDIMNVYLSSISIKYINNYNNCDFQNKIHTACMFNKYTHIFPWLYLNLGKFLSTNYNKIFYIYISIILNVFFLFMDNDFTDILNLNLFYKK